MCFLFCHQSYCSTWARLDPDLGLEHANCKPDRAVGLFVQVAYAADEIRLSTFPNVVLGTWAETAQQCAAKDKSNVVIEPGRYGDGDGSCAVCWIVESEASRGNNYAVRALCTSASPPEKSQTVNIIVRTLGPDRASMGRIYLRSAGSVFDDLKTYLRCP